MFGFKMSNNLKVTWSSLGPGLNLSSEPNETWFIIYNILNEIIFNEPLGYYH